MKSHSFSKYVLIFVAVASGLAALFGDTTLLFGAGAFALAAAMPIVIDPNKPEEAVKWARDFFMAARTQFHELDMSKLPEAFQTPIKALKDKVDAALAAIADKPTEQVPAASQAAYGFENLVRCLTYAQEMITGAFDQMNKMVANFTPKVDQLNELNTKIEKKDLLTREEVATAQKVAVDAAVADALKQENEKRTLLAGRRTQLCEAKLPAPLDDIVLEGDDKVFGDSKKSYGDRLNLLKEAGLVEQLQEAGELADTIYGTQRNFDRSIKLARLNAGKAGTTPEPLATQPGGEGKAGTEAAKRKYAF